MKTADVNNLLTAAAYVRNETIINGTQAAQLDAMIGQIKDLATKNEAVPAKIADLATQGKEKAVAMWERMAARYEAQFADAVATLRAWLVDFKANRPNANINLDEIDEPETPNPEPDNTPSTMNAEEKYNYLEAVTADVLNYIDENNITVTSENRDEIEQQLNDDLWTVDSVTGNGSGTYTFNRWTAETYICHNLDLLAEAVEEFGGSMDVLKDGAEACDVTIRCYLLAQAITAALDEVETEEEEEEPEEDTEA